jgi:hypothetical protein
MSIGVISMLFHCLPYSVLLILCEGVINDAINVTPSEGIGLGKTETFLMVSWWIVRKGVQLFSFGNI